MELKSADDYYNAGREIAKRCDSELYGTNEGRFFNYLMKDVVGFGRVAQSDEALVLRALQGARDALRENPQIHLTPDAIDEAERYYQNKIKEAMQPS